MPSCRLGSLSFALVWFRSNPTFARLYGLYGKFIWPLASADPIPTSGIIFLLVIHPVSINIMTFTERYLSHVGKKIRRRGTNREWLAGVNIVRLSNVFSTHSDCPKQRRQKKFFFYDTLPIANLKVQSRSLQRVTAGQKNANLFG